MEKIQITGFQPEDTEEMVDLFYTTVQTINRADYSKEAVAAWAPAEEQEYVCKEWKHSLLENQTYVAREEGKIIGFIDLRADGYLDRLYVHKDRQRMGVASALWMKAEKWAMQEGIPTIWTFSSITAKGFFERYGFQVMEPENVERNGVLLTRFHMKKMLVEG